MPESLFNKVAGVKKKKTLTQVFSSEFCEVFKNIYFTEHLRTTVSVYGANGIGSNVSVIKVCSLSLTIKLKREKKKEKKSIGKKGGSLRRLRKIFSAK